MTGLNFVVTIHRMRAPGMTWTRLPLFIWAHYATSIIQLLGTPVLAMTLVLVVLERALHLGIFDPTRGGDPLLFQHLFWFYSHPAVYIMILPAMGVVTEIVPCFSRKRIFGYKFVAMSSIGIAVFGFLVWAHHMFVAGISLYSALIFSMLSYLVAVPSAIKVFNWTATHVQGLDLVFHPMLYAFGFIGLFTMGGLTGLFLAALGIDVHVTDTYFVVAHFHYIMVGGAVMGYLGGMHFWWPKISGRMYPEALGQAGGADRLHRLQPDVLPAVRSGLSRHAAPLLAVSAGISGAERALHRRSHDSGGGICAAHGVFPVVHALRQDCPSQSLGRRWPGVDDHFAAAHLTISTIPRLWIGKLTITRTFPLLRRRALPIVRSPSNSTVRSCGTTSPTWSSSGSFLAGHVAVSGDGNHVLRRHVLRLSDLSPLVLQRNSPPPANRWTSRWARSIPRC